MARMAARILLRAGVAMLILCLLVRPAAETAHDRMGSNLAIIACVALILTGFIGQLIFRRSDDGPVADRRPRDVGRGE